MHGAAGRSSGDLSAFCRRPGVPAIVVPKRRKIAPLVPHPPACQLHMGCAICFSASQEARLADVPHLTALHLVQAEQRSATPSTRVP